MLKTYQRETTLFEFPRDAHRKELKIKTNITLQWLHVFKAQAFRKAACNFFYK